MIIRALNSSGDITFGQGTQNYLTGQAAIAENIQTRLKSFLNNCFWNMGAGIDWFTFLGGGNTSTQIQLACTAVIAQSFGVLAVNSVSVNTNLVNRSISVSYTITTIYTQNFTAILANLEELLLPI